MVIRCIKIGLFSVFYLWRTISFLTAVTCIMYFVGYFDTQLGDVNEFLKVLCVVPIALIIATVLVLLRDASTACMFGATNTEQFKSKLRQWIDHDYMPDMHKYYQFGLICTLLHCILTIFLPIVLLFNGYGIKAIYSILISWILVTIFELVIKFTCFSRDLEYEVRNQS